jgi:hypothetical protein
MFWRRGLQSSLLLMVCVGPIAGQTAQTAQTAPAGTPARVQSIDAKLQEALRERPLEA